MLVFVPDVQCVKRVSSPSQVRREGPSAGPLPADPQLGPEASWDDSDLPQRAGPRDASGAGPVQHRGPGLAPALEPAIP